MHKNILSSTLPLAISLILFFVVGNFGFGRIQSLRSQISEAGRDKVVLTEKLSTLRTLGDTVQTGSVTASSALPRNNSSLIAFSQIKSLAARNGLIISNLKSGVAQDAGGLGKVNIGFSAVGARAGIIAFLEEVQKAAPISMVDKIKLNEIAGQANAVVSVSTFFAEFPKTIPSITEPVADLTTDEKNILVKISTLEQPQFVVIPPGVGSGKTNPFAP